MQADLCIPILIVDDQTMLRVGLKLTLERIGGVKVLGEAVDGIEAVELAEKLRPAVIFMDVLMPRMDGIEATRAIKSKMAETRIIMFTSNDDDAAFLGALQAGADAYCLKDATEKQLESAMVAVLQGAKWLDSGLASRVLYGGNSSSHKLNRSLIGQDQKKILELIENGMNIEQIAANLNVDVTQVKIILRTAVDGLEPNPMNKPTLVMSNLRSMLEEKVVEKSSELQAREKKIGSIVASKYKIEKVLGKGGMSVVYLARHTTLGKLVAIKMMHLSMATTSSFLQRIEREAKIASSINHPNVVEVHDFGEDENEQPFLIMDYVSGDTLEEMIEQCEKLDAKACIPIFVQICDALTAMHDRGIVHRDLKPSNVLVKMKSGGLHVTLVDLGIAKSVVESSSARLTVAGHLFGSPTYMSPEQCVGQDADYRSDLYSFGCLMYDTLTGDPPFTNESSYNVMWQHVNEPPSRVPFLSEESNIPEQLERIVFKLLNKEPEMRYQSAADLKAELSALVQDSVR